MEKTLYSDKLKVEDLEILVCFADLFNAKLWLNEEENRFVVHHENEERHKNIEIHLNGNIFFVLYWLI